MNKIINSESSQCINVVYITDRKYVVATASSIQSLKISNQNLFVTVYVLSAGLDSEQKSNFELMGSENFTVKVIEIPLPDYKNTTVNTYVTEASLIKFSLPVIFSNEDRILYLDGDTFITGSLETFYKQPFDNKYAVVIRDIVAEEYHNHLRLGLGKYFNSGVMLLNLKLMREHNLTEKLQKKKREDPGRFMDQDTFNSVFNENVIYGDGRYNLMMSNFLNFGLTISYVNNFYGWQYPDFATLENDVHIFHLTNHEKPWTHKNCYKSDEWLKVFEKTPFSVVKLDLLEQESLDRTNYPYLEEQLNFKGFNVKKISLNTSTSFEFEFKVSDNKKIDVKNIELLYELLNKEIIVSITSYPARIPYLAKSLNSVYAQSITFDRCILWLDPEEFPNKENDLPEELLKFKKLGLSICWKKNLKPHTKYFYAFKEFPDQIIITLDDDIIYERDTLKNLFITYIKFPQSVIANRTHRILFDKEGKLKSYSNWEWDTKRFLNVRRFDLVATGVLGVLYPNPRKLFKSNLIDQSEIENYSLDQDDLYLKFIEIDAGVPVVRSYNSTRLDFVPGSQVVGLNLSNVLQNRNDILMKELEQRFFIKANEECSYLKRIIEKKQHEVDVELCSDNVPKSCSKPKSWLKWLLHRKRVMKDSSVVLGASDSLLTLLADKEVKKILGEIVVYKKIQSIYFSSRAIPRFVNEMTGLSIVENWGRWSDSNIDSAVNIDFVDYLPNTFTLEIRLRSFLPTNCLEIKIGKMQQPIKLHNNLQTVTIHCELEGVLTKQINLKPIFSASPSELNKSSKDERRLGIGIVCLKIIQNTKRYL